MKILRKFYQKSINSLSLYSLPLQRWKFCCKQQVVTTLQRCRSRKLHDCKIQKKKNNFDLRL